jgi:hypothetical protein
MRMRREPCHNGLAQFAKVVREAGHFVALYSGVDGQHAGPALHDNGVALDELALVDQHTIRDLPQHGLLPFLVFLRLVETVIVQRSAGSLHSLPVDVDTVRRLGERWHHECDAMLVSRLITLEIETPSAELAALTSVAAS